MSISLIPIPNSAPSASASPARKEAREDKAENRTIILCFDGTGNDVKVTNVVKLYSLMRKDSKNQLCYYQAGVGTYFSSGIKETVLHQAGLALDKAIDLYLYQHLIDGYEFLMRNYDAGDRVCLFGFSRGAYTARALAGMLSKVGLLSKGNMEQIPFVYKLYKSTRPSEVAIVQGFKKSFCRPVSIHFVGVWDTVASVGVVKGKSLPFVDENTVIRVFRQGLSLDEHRTKFRPSLYRHGVLDPSGKAPELQDSARDNTLSGENLPDVDQPKVKEVWFVGSHRDVGGGNAPSKAEPALANIPLRWMIQEIRRTETKIEFNEDEFAQWNIPTTREYLDRSIAQERGEVAKEDAQDALRPITDPPSETSPQGNWKTKWRSHRESGRQVPPNSLFHPSVKTRMDDPKLNYTPKAKYDKDQVKFES